MTRLLLDTCAVIDPSDHIIIAHAITERLTLLSSDEKFPFYRNQGLELIEY
jgi:PIN domain nuclease of toxin-antitoxin system